MGSDTEGRMSIRRRKFGRSNPLHECRREHHNASCDNEDRQPDQTYQQCEAEDALFRRMRLTRWRELFG